jgi:CHAT domain-containing protein
MQQFYTELRAGHGRGAALRSAQLACLDSDNRHPFFWAALVLTGDWR